MNANRVRLINAARKALFQRAQLKRSAESARSNFAPLALKQRAKTKALRQVETAMESAESGLRKYSLPIGIAALAGLAFAFRRPLGTAASVVAAEADKAIKALTDHFAETTAPTPPNQPAMEQPDEPV